MNTETYHYNGKQIELKLNGSDCPSCPNCGHYNAMLWHKYVNAPSDDYSLKCRDCGAEVVAVVRTDEAMVKEVGIPDDLVTVLFEALTAIEPFLSDEKAMLDYAAMNNGQTSGFDLASMKVRRAIGRYLCTLPVLNRDE